MDWLAAGARMRARLCKYAIAAVKAMTKLRRQSFAGGKVITELPLETDATTVTRIMTLSDEISADELRALMATGANDANQSVQLLDVRSSLERLFGAIKPSAHVSLGALEKPDASALLAKQGLRPDKRTVVYCASGMRSLRALEVLRERHGFTRAQSLHGGMRAWRRV